MTAHYRVDYAGRSRLLEKEQRLNKHMHILLRMAQANDGVAVVVTNQMQLNPDGSIFGEKFTPVGGQVMLYASTYRIHLRCLSPEKFCAKLDISPCILNQIQTL